MKRILKADRLAFNAAIAAMLAPYPSDPSDPRTRRAMTDCGPLTIRPDPVKHGDHIAVVFARFQDTEHPVFLERRSGLGASAVGKWNITSWNLASLEEELTERLAWVHARPPTPVENAAWTERERVKAAEYCEKLNLF